MVVPGVIPAAKQPRETRERVVPGRRRVGVAAAAIDGVGCKPEDDGRNEVVAVRDVLLRIAIAKGLLAEKRRI
jgi:hypothetical protein